MVSSLYKAQTRGSLAHKLATVSGRGLEAEGSSGGKGEGSYLGSKRVYFFCCFQ
jgi:hypothetical protein